MRLNLKKALSVGTAITMAASLAGCTKTTVSSEPSAVDSQQSQVVQPDGQVASEKPNIVYIYLDDTGYSDLGCYGSTIRTPNIDALAQSGVQYSNYYTTPLSSPSRAALLTGCEPNSVGMGSISDFAFGEIVPNIQGKILPEHGTIAQTLQENGYNTMTVGKWHLSPYDELNANGNRQYWPSGMGFDKYYSFTSGLTNQMDPGSIMTEGKIVEPDIFSSDYHFTNDMVDRSIGFINEFKEGEEAPFFMYFATGAMHGPLQVDKSYIERYKGQFDEGWDVEREKRFENQKKLGLFEADETMAERDPKVPFWDEMSDVEKAVAARHMEVYAGFLEHTDEQIGRLISELKAMGEYENTIFFLASDNGASFSSGVNGSHMNVAMENALVFSAEEQFLYLDKIGSAEYGGGYNLGWAMSSNTPFSRYKQTGYFGGVRVPMIISSAKTVNEPNRICKELVSVYDVSPTMLDIIGVEQSMMLNGVEQEEMQGISFKNTMESSTAQVTPHDLFIMMSDTAAYTDGNGYMIVLHSTTGWKMFDMEKDQTQVHDLVEEMPEKFNELLEKYEVSRTEHNSENLFMDFAQGATPEELIQRYGGIAEAAFNLKPDDGNLTNLERENKMLMDAFVYPVFPGRVGMASFMYNGPNSKFRPQDHTYHKADGILPSLATAPLTCRSYSITTDIKMNNTSDEGVLCSNGGVDGGYTLYIKDGFLTYEYKYADENQFIKSSVPMKEGDSKIEYIYSKKDNYSGIGTLKINGETVGESLINQYPLLTSYDYFSVGEDAGSLTSKEYSDNYVFTGEVETVKVHLEEDTFINPS